MEAVYLNLKFQRQGRPTAETNDLMKWKCAAFDDLITKVNR
jgi:hypothetical protein